MTAERPRRIGPPDRRAQRLRPFLAACSLLAGAVAVSIAMYGPSSEEPAPPLWLLAALWATVLAAGTTKVGLPARGIGGVPEHTTLLEIGAVLVMVFLPPGWAVLVAVSASLVFEIVVHRHAPRKVVFNTASEALSIALGGATYHALAGPGFDASLGAILAGLLAGVVYILVNLGMMVLLSAVLSSAALDALRGEETVSSLLVSSGIATTGVMTAVLAAAAPWALPLVAVPTLLDFLRARGRQEGLELAASKQAAEQANRAKSEFLSRMSHELRTPLNAMLGYGQLLEADGRLDADTKESVQVILRSGWHLRQIVDEVLDLSQIEAGRMTLSMEPVRLADVAAESVDLVAPLASARTVEIALTGDELELFAYADHQRLRQVLINLLSNAVKYNHEGGSVTVIMDRGDGQVVVDVVDTGPGLAPEDLDRLFVPFERLAHDRSEVEGNGLGLSVTRRFVEAMDGEIEVTSALGEGSTFTVRLPDAEMLDLDSTKRDR